MVRHRYDLFCRKQTVSKTNGLKNQSCRIVSDDVDFLAVFDNFPAIIDNFSAIFDNFLPQFGGHISTRGHISTIFRPFLAFSGPITAFSISILDLPILGRDFDLDFPCLKSDLNLELPSLKRDLDLELPSLKSDLDLKLPSLKSDLDLELLSLSPDMDSDCQV